MQNIFKYDFYRYHGTNWRLKEIKYIVSDHSLWYLFLLRKLQTDCGGFIKFVAYILLRKASQKYGLEISPSTVIGKGLYLGHAFNITVNPDTILGNNININKGVTIGQENRGKRKGTPNIGDKVWIGVNTTIVGNISIGDDVLIAPNSFVNIDIPSHSIAIGNPCKIISKEDATKDYINRIV